ncbi:5650_t:CDS:2, partial [Cetraspora pellucida]
SKLLYLANNTIVIQNNSIQEATKRNQKPTRVVVKRVQERNRNQTTKYIKRRVVVKRVQERNRNQTTIYIAFTKAGSIIPYKEAMKRIPKPTWKEKSKRRREFRNPPIKRRVVVKRVQERNQNQTTIYIAFTKAGSIIPYKEAMKRIPKPTWKEKKFRNPPRKRRVVVKRVQERNQNQTTKYIVFTKAGSIIPYEEAMKRIPKPTWKEKSAIKKEIKIN